MKKIPVKNGVTIMFYLACNADRKPLIGVVEHKEHLGFFVNVDNAQYYLGRLVDVRVLPDTKKVDALRHLGSIDRSTVIDCWWYEYIHGTPTLSALRTVTGIKNYGRILKHFEGYTIEELLLKCLNEPIY
jgi:hypothetical protein